MTKQSGPNLNGELVAVVGQAVEHALLVAAQINLNAKLESS
jgi:hypothetical protein